MDLSKSIAFCRHWLTAQTRYAVHSPFVYQWVTQVLPHKATEAGARIEALRRARAADRKSRFEIRDFGAGYGGQAQPVIHKSMAEVVRSSARGRREGELLQRLVRHQQATCVLELGGNLGFSTAYLAAGLQEGGDLRSIEGAPALAAHAEAMLSGLGLKASVITGEFGEVLRDMDWDRFAPDLVLMDGNHTYEATMAYFEALLPVISDGACLVVDDVHWSAGMWRAWQEMAAHPDCSVSIDLFFMGIIYVRRQQEKEAFRFRFRPA